MSKPDLFGHVKPRAKPRKLMKVIDAGEFPDGKAAINFKCPHCGFDEGWTYRTETVTKAKIGRPCPRCNEL